MFDRIAKIIADAVIEKVLPALHKEIVDNVVPRVQESVDRYTEEAKTFLQKAADDAVVRAFAALDANNDGKIDLNDLFRR